MGLLDDEAPTFLDNRLTNDGEVVRLTRRPCFTHRKINGTHFCYMLSRSLGNYLIANRTRDLPVCNIGSQPTTLQRAHPDLTVSNYGAPLQINYRA
jgi:hypothetical protein